jgi:hypothetical protein
MSKCYESDRARSPLPEPRVSKRLKINKTTKMKPAYLSISLIYISMIAKLTMIDENNVQDCFIAFAKENGAKFTTWPSFKLSKTIKDDMKLIAEQYVEQVNLILIRFPFFGEGNSSIIENGRCVITVILLFHFGK